MNNFLKTFFLCALMILAIPTMAMAGTHATHKRSHSSHHGHHAHHKRHAHKTRRTRAKHAQQKSHSAALPQPCVDTELTPAAGNLELIRAATFCLVNQERTSRGEAPLQPNARLRQSAQAHTASMVSEDYFGHYGPGGDTPTSRMIAAGYIYSSRIGYEVGENIAWGTLWLATPKAIVAAWMASPGHRANILDAHYRDTAIGVSPQLPSSLGAGQPGAIYTQDFGVIITG